MEAMRQWLAGEAWLSEAVLSHPEPSPKCCSNANLLGDSGISGSRFKGTERAGRESEEESEVMKLITPDSLSTADWSSFTVCSNRGTLKAFACSSLILLARASTWGFVDLQSSRQLGHNHWKPFNFPASL